MNLAREGGDIVKTGTIEVDIFNNYKISLGWFEGDKVVSKNIKVNISNAKIKSAKLKMFWHSDETNVCTDVWFNDEKVLNFVCGGIGGCDISKEADVQIDPKDNTITVKVYRYIPFPNAVSITIISAKLIITYEIEETPTQPTQPAQPTQPSKPESSKQSNISNLILDVIAGVVVGGITYMLFRRRR